MPLPDLCDSYCSCALILIFCTATESLWCGDKVPVSRPVAPAVIHRHSAGHTLTTPLVCLIHLSSSHKATDSNTAIVSSGSQEKRMHFCEAFLTHSVALLLWCVVGYTQFRVGLHLGEK